MMPKDIKLNLMNNLAQNYSSLSQKARVTTEPWVVDNLCCPRCMGYLASYASNTKGKDVYCVACGEEFQIKSKKSEFSKKITGADFKTTIDIFSSERRPSLILLQYDLEKMRVNNLKIVHRHYLNRECVIPRKPLAVTARRAGWQGCIIDLSHVPCEAEIVVVDDLAITPALAVQEKWCAVVDQCFQSG